MNKHHNPGQLVVTKFKPKPCKRCKKMFRPIAAGQLYCSLCRRVRAKGHAV